MSTSHAAARSAAGQHNLPAQLPSLIGRDEAVANVCERLQAERGLLTLTGTGGSGKTRLALAVATEALDAFPQGVWLAQLAPISEATLVSTVVATSIGVAEQLGRPIRETLLEELRWRSLLLVLDNCEHLVEACAALAVDLLRACPGVRILATSREPLHVLGELTWRVPTLPTPDPRTLPDREEIAGYPAVRLFVERAHAVQPDFVLTTQNSLAVAGICSRLDGLPLAIELAAARTVALAPEQILPRLDDAIQLLVGGSRGAPTRQQTLKATLDWSYLLLPPVEQQLFRRSAVFGGGFDLDAAEAICGGEGTEPNALLDALTGLVKRSLVVAQEHGGVMRYRLLEPVRQYAYGLLVESGEWERVSRSHADYFLVLAGQGAEGLKGRDEVAWADRLEWEHDNMRAVLRRYLDAGDADTTLRLGSALWQFWKFRNHRNEGARWLEEALACRGDVASEVRARALQQAGEMAFAMCDFDRSRAWYEESLTICRALGDRSGIATILSRLGRLLWKMGRLSDERERAQAAVEESLALFRQLGDTSGMGWALIYLGSNSLEGGDLGRAESELRESADLFEQRGERHMRAHSIELLGSVVLEQGKPILAERLHEESLTVSREVGCVQGAADSLTGLAQVARTRGDLVRAAGLCAEAVPLYQKVGMRYELSTALDVLAGLAAPAFPEHAARLFAAADALRDGGIPSVAPHGRAARERELAKVRGALGGERFDSAWAVGAARTLDEVVEDAREAAAGLTQPPGVTAPDPLTPREREVAALLALGYSNRRIAEELIISERTVDGHVGNILAKLGLQNRSQVVLWAAEHPLTRIPG